MKKIYISVDMEGIGSMVCPDQMRFREMNEERRLRATKEVNSVIEGLLKGGVEEIIVNDSHPPSLNLIPDMLNKAARLIRGSLRLRGTLEGIDSSYDGLILVGLHAKSGTSRGILNHTWIHSIYDLRVNGKSIGEIGINALYSGEYGVPVLMVAGDKAACEEAENLIPGVRTVATKFGVSRYAGITLHPDIVCEKLTDESFKLTGANVQVEPMCCKRPVNLEIDFVNTAEAEIAAIFPEIKQTGDRTVSYKADNFVDTHHAFMAVSALALTVKDEAPGDLIY